MSRLELLDFRRRVAELYHDVRSCDDARDGHARWVAGREQLYRTHPESAAHTFVLRHAPYRDDLRFVVPVVATQPHPPLAITTGTDGLVHYEHVGQVQLPGVGALDVWWAAVYGGGIWLPVKDASPTTYGGGRYVLDTVKGADLGGTVDPATGRAQLVVDLNFAYNPSCVYDERWACPLAPPGNVVDAELEVGELLPAQRD